MTKKDGMTLTRTSLSEIGAATLHKLHYRPLIMSHPGVLPGGYLEKYTKRLKFPSKLAV